MNSTQSQSLQQTFAQLNERKISVIACRFSSRSDLFLQELRQLNKTLRVESIEPANQTTETQLTVDPCKPRTPETLIGECFAKATTRILNKYVQKVTAKIELQSRQDSSTPWQHRNINWLNLTNKYLFKQLLLISFIIIHACLTIIIANLNQNIIN